MIEVVDLEVPAVELFSIDSCSPMPVVEPVLVAIITHPPDPGPRHFGMFACSKCGELAVGRQFGCECYMVCVKGCSTDIDPPFSVERCGL